MNVILRLCIVYKFVVLVGFFASIQNCRATDFQPILGWDGHLYPSYIVATATMPPPKDEAAASRKPDQDITLGDRNGVLGVRVQAPFNNAPIVVTVLSDGWLESSSISVVLPEKGAFYRIMPKLKFRYAELVKTKQTVPATIEFQVKLNGKGLSNQSLSAVLHSINDCPFSVSQEDETKEFGFVFAAYVNEQHPFIDKVLREALDGGIVKSFDGYQSGSEAEVLRQVYAIWDALASRDLRYSNITRVAAEAENIGSQHVRLLDESINNAQANCVDGSVLMASVLRKIDIEPYLVFVPGHCYLAFALDEAGEHIVGLETTLIGSDELDPDESDEDDDTLAELIELLDDETLELVSFESFRQALKIGTQDLEDNSEKFDADNDADFQLISITAARKSGILPIAFQADKEFKQIEP